MERRQYLAEPMSGRSPYTNEAYGGEQGVAGPSGTVGGYAPGMDSNALENAIQVRISGSLHVGCILSAKCKMPKGAAQLCSFDPSVKPCCFGLRAPSRGSPSFCP